MLVMNRAADAWDPDRYQRFRAERDRPAHDLVALLRPAPGGDAVDLGCGTGRHTALLHRHLGTARTLGIDSSPRMLAESPPHARAGIDFDQRDLRDLTGHWDVIFANASLQWVPGHPDLLPRLVDHLRPHGQLAFQVPANFDHPSHTVADRIGRSFGLEPRADYIDSLSPAAYAERLWHAGLRDLDVSLRIYGVEMERTEHVLDWVSGTLLTRAESALDPDDFAAFRAEYRRALLEELGDPEGDRPYYYAFPRILAHGSRPA